MSGIGNDRVTEEELVAQNLEAIAARLNESDDYRVLRRLKPRARFS